MMSALFADAIYQHEPFRKRDLIGPAAFSGSFPLSFLFVLFFFQ